MHVIVTPTQSFTRPADITAYASGDLVANSTTAGSVAALEFPGGPYLIRRAIMTKSQDATTGASFRLHLFSANPVASAPAAGDNGALSLNVASSGYIGSMDFAMTTAPDIYNTAGNLAAAAPLSGSEMLAPAAANVVYGLIEARGAYTPASGETFSVKLECLVP
jgi:hypothetical protein